MEEKIIEIKDIRKTYQLYDKPVKRLIEAMSPIRKSYHRDHFALDCVNLDVYKGECVGIIGTNGSGKSTLLKIITGVLTPTAGDVTINGRISALLELGTGFNPEYTGLENIYLSGTMNGFTRSEMDAKVDQIVEFAEIGEFINQPVKTYSSGMFARLGFAVAINVDPDILIVDEALSVGDIFFQSKCFHKFNEFKDAGKTILFVSHDLGSIIKYCDRSLLLHHGKQIMVGPSSEVVDVYKKILVNQYDESDLTESSENEEKEETNPEQLQNNKTTEIADWKSLMIQNPNALVYGNGKASIVDYCVIDQEGNIGSAIFKDTKCTIRMKVLFHEDVENPIFAFTIKDIKGTEITGTNTMIQNCMCGQKRKGEEVIVSFEQEMHIQGGQYLISLGCTGYEAEDFVVYQRLYDVINMQVHSQRNTVGYFDTCSVIQYGE